MYPQSDPNMPFDEAKFATVEVRLDRLIQDVEEEKKTSRSYREKLTEKIDANTKLCSIGIGIMVTLQVIIPILPTILKH